MAEIKTIDNQFLLVTIGKNRYTVVRMGLVGKRERKGTWWKVENVTKKKVVAWKKKFQSKHEAITKIKLINKED